MLSAVFGGKHFFFCTEHKTAEKTLQMKIKRNKSVDDEAMSTTWQCDTYNGIRQFTTTQKNMNKHSSKFPLSRIKYCYCFDLGDLIKCLIFHYKLRAFCFQPQLKANNISLSCIANGGVSITFICLLFLFTFDFCSIFDPHIHFYTTLRR